MLGSWIRKAGFWGLDAVKGREVRKKYKELNSIRRDSQPNEKALRQLLLYAIENVPAYNGIKAPDLTQFPIVCKDDYRAAYDTYRSTMFVNDKALHKVYTSGSTGSPFMAVQNREKQLYHKAGLIGINDEIGWNLGDRYLFLRMWDGAHATSKLNHFIQNAVPFDVKKLDEKHLEDIRLRLIKDKQLNIILGYASAIDVLSEYLEEKGHTEKDFNVRLVVSDSECLRADVKRRIKRVFGCPVLDRYANNENGILALTTPESSTYRVNFPEYYIELVDLHSDKPAKPGEVGRIVITDIYNKAFPFIRYDTGDLGVANKMCGNAVLELKSITGRVADLLTDTTGNKLGETVVTAAFEDAVFLRRYQIIQHKDGYEMRIEKPFSGSIDEVNMRLHKLLGDDADVKITFTEKIPLGKNGKLKTMYVDN